MIKLRYKNIDWACTSSGYWQCKSLGDNCNDCPLQSKGDKDCSRTIPDSMLLKIYNNRIKIKAIMNG